MGGFLTGSSENFLWGGFSLCRNLWGGLTSDVRSSLRQWTFHRACAKSLIKLKVLSTVAIIKIAMHKILNKFGVCV